MDTKPIDISEFVLKYLTEDEEAMKSLITMFLNKVMQHFGIEVSRSTVSRMTAELDEEIKGFQSRPIEKRIRFLYVDAAYLKVREDHRYVSRALFIAVGVREDGYKEVLGVRLADNEGEEFWLEFFESLKERGLGGVELVISDGHQRIKNATRVCFNGSSWQMCNVHFRRLAMKSVPMKDRKAVNTLVKKAMESPEDLQRACQDLEPKHPKVIRMIEKYYHDLFNYQAYPRYMWKKLRTTNMLERTIEEIKRRSKVIGAFPNPESALRLATTILMNTDEEWITDKRHILIETDQETEKETKIELEVQG